MAIGRFGEIDKRIAVYKAILLREAESREHKRLTGVLDALAQGEGFDVELVSFPNGSRPDVLRHSTTLEALFIGEAKISANERVSTAKTWQRVSGYLEEFRRLIAEKQIVGGYFALATDDKNAADEWAAALTREAQAIGLSRGDGLWFAVISHDNSWIAAW